MSWHPIADLPPHHVSTKSPNLQPRSPLWSILPAELRTQIFHLALQEYPSPARNPWPFHQTYLWPSPSYAGLKRLSTTLLRTCRLAYAETWFLPPLQKEHVFWHEDAVACPPYLAFKDETQYFSRRRWTTDNLSLVQALHFFTQQHWLESSLYYKCLWIPDTLPNLQKLTLTIRHGDWRGSESGAAFAICPRRGTVDVERMRADWRDEDSKGASAAAGWCRGGWGSAFMQVPSLRVLVLEFETCSSRGEEMGLLVERARKWAFPAAGDGMVFGCHGSTVRSWTAPLVEGEAVVLLHSITYGLTPATPDLAPMWSIV